MRGRSDSSKSARAQRGMSMVELVVVFGIVAVVATLAIPQLVGMRRNLRASAVPMEIKAQLRFARQTAMGRRRAVTFTYRTDIHELSVIEHDGVGAAVLNDPAYPLTAGHTNLRSIPLAPTGSSGGSPSDHIAYGLPSGATTQPLDDTTTLTAPSNNRVNITFQPDGSVVDAAGATRNVAMMFYHPDHPEATLRAVSVLGASGRVKSWRYTDANTFVE